MRSGLALGLVFFGSLITASADPGRTVLEKGFYSFEAPPGWTVQPPSQALLQTCTGPSANGFPATMRISVLNGAKTAAEVADTCLDDGKANRWRDLRSVIKQPFLTAAGLDGFRVVATYNETNPARQVVVVNYVFQSSEHEKVWIVATCLARDAAHYVPLFDAAMKGFTLE
jgi:hypothetical protein